MGFLERLFSTKDFMPHSMCYENDSQVISLHVISDAVIALAYYSIPLTLIYFVRKRKDLAFDWMFLCFAAFIILCGTTHLMEILNIWVPVYWLAGLLKACTALISIATAILLIKLVPQALALPSPAQLRKSNDDLQKEIREREQATRKIESLNQELILNSAKMQNANKELETFAYSVSHDLRAPLRHVDGYVNLLQEETANQTEASQRYMKKISDSARQMGVLIDNLLAFSGMGRSQMQPEMTDMGEIVARAKEELAPDMQSRDITWNIAPLPKVYGDKNLLRQVWLNLLGNAIKYTKKSGKTEISIGCTEHAKEFEFYIKDNGAGFDMQYVDKLFGVFQRLHLKEEFEGTGIGLANVQRIVARHGGRTWAHGELNKGATFFFALPKVDLSKVPTI
jgi:signal transduction histidine kinase